MSENTEPRTLTDVEHTAILAATVARETAELNDKLAAKDAELVAAQNALDVEKAAKATLEAEKAAAVKEFEDYKLAEVAKAEQAALATTRMAQVKESAPHLTEEDLKNEGRVARVVAMNDEDFNAYIGDLKAASGAPAGKTVVETAMKGGVVKAPVASETTVQPAAAFLFPGLEGK